MLLVVNATSAGSKRVGNHYTRLRNLPASNVLALDYEGSKETVNGETFRTEILQPVLQAINERGLGLQIDTITYSTDFPWRVTLSGDYPEDLKLPPQMRPNASITAATYLYGFVLAKSPGLTALDSNWYFARSPGQAARANVSQCRVLNEAPSRAFRSRYAWTKAGDRAEKRTGGRRYLMSTMLGVTTGRGLSVDEVIESLERAVEADRTPPDGTFYFMRNSDVRSKTRHACFEEAANQLHDLGAKASVMMGVRPQGATDVAGLMMGKADLELDTAGMTIQPGAICEHLTSAGGLLFENGYQTPLTDLIRAGATGASGTVEEPYAIQAKFPTPALQLHYRRGCSLAEAFYQSVAGPYQLLIVGDPLCQPWAERPGLQVEGWPKPPEARGEIVAGSTSTIGMAELGLAPPEEKPEEVPEGALKLTPQVTPVSGSSGIAYWELFIDGRLRMRLPSGKSVSFEADKLGPGWHELRCVGIDPGPIEAQKLVVGSLEADAPSGAVTLAAKTNSYPVGDDVALRVAGTGAERIVIRHDWREVAVVEGPEGEAVVPAELLGRGPVRLQAVAEPSGAASSPIWVTVE